MQNRYKYGCKTYEEVQAFKKEFDPWTAYITQERKRTEIKNRKND